jgi:hypothetical protein
LVYDAGKLHCKPLSGPVGREALRRGISLPVRGALSTHGRRRRTAIRDERHVQDLRVAPVPDVGLVGGVGPGGAARDEGEDGGTGPEEGEAVE